MKLYSFYNSSSAYRVRIALNLKGLTPEMIPVNLTKGEQKSEDYAKINPQMIVPTLIDGGAVLSQSLAIMEYLEEVHPQPPLLPTDSVARAHTRALALEVACDISPLGNLKVRKYLASKLGQSEEQCSEWIRHWISDGLAAFERILASSPLTGTYCVGDTPTMADCCLIPQLYNARRWGADLTPYPILLRLAAACETHQAFISAHPDNQPDTPKTIA